MVRELEEQYWHGWHDAIIAEHKSQDKPVFTTDTRELPKFVEMPTSVLEKTKLFCIISGIDNAYGEYLLSVQLANRKAKGNYFKRLWGAIRNRIWVVIDPEPEYLWMERFAFEFASRLREAKVIADIVIKVNAGSGCTKELRFEALTWRKSS